MTEHKHAEVLRAIADGKEVECRPKGYYGNADWFTTMNIINPINPITRPDYEWRVKPEPKPDVSFDVEFVLHNLPHNSHIFGYRGDTNSNNLRLTFDGETGKLKSAEVLE